MKKVILYKNSECIAIKSICISEEIYTFFVQLNNKKIIYLKQKIVNDKIVYASLDKIIKVFTKYQTPGVFNAKVMLDTFVNTINYKIKTGSIVDSDEILEIIYQFEKIINDPYIVEMTSSKQTTIFSHEAMQEVTDTIKKLDGKRYKMTLSELLHTKDESENDVFLSQNWLTGDFVDNKKLLYESIKKSNIAHKKSPVDFLFNNKVLNVYMIVIIVSVVGFVSCLDFIIKYRNDDINIEKQIEEMKEQNESDMVDYKKKNSNSNEEKPIYTPRNFTPIIEKNDDTVGWLTVYDERNTEKKEEDAYLVDLPVVQSNHNQDASNGKEFYLDHDFNKEKNDKGWIYADLRSDIKDLGSTNTIIYGHANSLMFGPLLKTRDGLWWKSKKNQTIKLETPYYDSYWKVVSVYLIKKSEASSIFKVKFYQKDEFKHWANEMISRSEYKFGSVNIEDSTQFLTLSTCNGYDESKRVIVQAVLECKTIPGGACKSK